jgi:hypothetical protein
VSARHAEDAARAALTAASTSAAEPCATDASFSPFEGSTVSKYSPAAGACHPPPMKCWKRIAMTLQPGYVASFESSGAGPYSMLTNFSAMLIETLSICHPERSEGSASCRKLQIPRFARDDNLKVKMQP